LQEVPEVRAPESSRRPVSDSYYGISVVDDYRWLENGSDPEVAKWIERQNRLTQDYVNAIPARREIEQRLRELYSKITGLYSDAQFVKGELYFLKFQPPKQQPFVVALDSSLEGERTVFDPNEFDRSGRISVDWFEVSPDSSKIAICLSKGGSEDGSVYTIDTKTGRQLDQVVPRVNYPTGGGSLAWLSDSSGFYYTRYPMPGEKPQEDLNFYQKIFLHKLGQNPLRDALVLGEDFPRIAESRISSSDSGKYTLVTVANGDGGEFCHYLLGPEKKWIKLTEFEDKAKFAKFGKNDELYFLSIKEDPKGIILKLAPSETEFSKARVLIRPREGAIEDFAPSSKLVYVCENIGGPSKNFAYDVDGRFLIEIESEAISSTGEIEVLENDEILFESQSFVSPLSWYRFNPATNKKEPTRLKLESLELNGYEVSREFAESRDGTKVPLSIIKKSGLKRDGTNPTLLTGYGGYGVGVSPSFMIRRIPFLERGGIWAVANLRGGGEYGEEWHAAGKRKNKQNVFDDFFACASHLIERAYTRPDKLAIEGGSNGGLLMGAALTQKPELFAAVISHVGIYDMLRVELDDNGAFNVTEFGTVKDPEEFKALYAYSPYHQVKDGTSYPAVLFTAGENDGRVEAYHSRKMAALLQRATTSGKPVLLRSNKSGHGIGTALDEQIAEDSDLFAFLFQQLRMG
jgi:prolyl oligopeptidase